MVKSTSRANCPLYWKAIVPAAPESAACKGRLEQAVAEARASTKPNYSALARKYNVKRESIMYHLRETPPTTFLRY